jgi:group I intron endonuclease
MGIVYKATNKINGKAYIGQTCRSLTRRRNEHKRAALDDKYKSPFHEAMRKYGVDNFEWEILAERKTTRSLDRAEARLIRKYKSHCKENGYNLTSGGHVLRGRKNPFYGQKHTDEVKKLISETNKGRPGHNKGKHLSEETRRKIREAIKARGGLSGKNNPMYGRRKVKRNESYFVLVRPKKT